MPQAVTDHHPEQFYWDAETEHCPHKPIPKRYTDAWDEWMTLGHQLYDDGVLCLSAPAMDGCPTCTEDDGEMVPWSACRVRDHARAHAIPPFPQHQPVTADVGSLECWERECDDFFTDDGDEIPGKETCSHLREMEVCAACSEPPADGLVDFPAVVPWADCPHNPDTKETTTS